ncbi:MAG: 4-alpha-glucanotransferase, partial [Proteobacteria bacterium]|nr:4-alpha-glucanotransferase [Burkholderiales bacterium]
ERVEGLSNPETLRAICREHAPPDVRCALRAAEHVDYSAVARIKLAVLRALFEAFRRDEAGSVAAASFSRFQASTEGLRTHSTYQSIQLALHTADPSVWGWPCWPAPLRDPGSPEVAAWQQANAEEIAFHEFLEWQARLQWQRVRARARVAGVALYGDLALGADRGGSEVWGAQDDYALAISTGCPPDDFNLQGQDWGLPPYRPNRLRATACAPFRTAIEAGMAQFDALRLDHVMSLMRLFWIPAGGTPALGAYIDYPFDSLLATLKIESVRHRCMVIGEDLGTVPPAVREGLASAEVLSYRLLVFERDAATHFRRPDAYPRLALAALGSHDLSPLQGWWTGDDLALRERLGLLDRNQFERFSWDRGEARQGLLATLAEIGLLPEGASTEAGRYPMLPPDLVEAVHAFLARTESMWAMVNAEDAFDLVDATNLPGTTDEHPNWRRKVPVPIEDWAPHPRLSAIARTMRDGGR